MTTTGPRRWESPVCLSIIITIGQKPVRTGAKTGSAILAWIEIWKSRWYGERWRWWSLAGGVALVLVTAAVAALASALVGERISALLTIGLLAELLVLSVVGTGMLTGTTRRMSRGGLARESASIDVDRNLEEQRKADQERDRLASDRRTIRCGIMTVPLFLTLVYLLVR